MNNLLFSMADLSAGMVKFLDNTLGIWYLIILNAFGVIAIICKIFEYQVKSRNAMFVLVTIASICWVLYFALYGNFASALTCLLSVIKMLIFMQRGKHKWADGLFWLILFLVLQTVVAVFTTTGWTDVFAIVAGYVGIFSYFVLDQSRYRLLSFFHMALWVVNSTINFYLIALLSDSFSTISCGVAIYRYDLSKNARKLRKVEKENKNSVISDTENSID